MSHLMSRGILATRSSQQERMDTDCAGYEDYARCLRDLSRVNVVTLTHRPMLRWLRRHASEAFSLLDVACGHGDALRAVRARFPAARLTGIDLNPWAIRAASEATPAEAGIRFVNADAFAYRAEAGFDFIITSQFAHHLTDDEVVRFLAWLDGHAAKGWFISDLHRHALPYYGFPLLARVASWHHFVRSDGQISIARAFRPAEWRALLDRAGLAGRASVRWHVPFRLCVSHP
jgi:2-polyprenyl-3-methyl-5-hydroxy-6-metoxy-1,4-benzoquinol methylase